MNRIFIFHLHEGAANGTTMLPAYYIAEDYSKVAVRINAITAPATDAQIDVLADGVSIFSNPKYTVVDATTGVISTLNDHTYVVLPAGSNSEEIAEDFNGTPIEQGSWLTCKVEDSGGGKGFTVQVELEQLSEDSESED